MKQIKIPLSVLGLALLAVAASPSAGKAQTCDELASRLITKAVRPPIETLDCSALARAGLDRPDHHLRSVCYSSTGPQSTIEIVADLTCRTSDAALIRASVSDRLTAKATVTGSTCKIEHIDINAAGDLGSGLLRAFDVNGMARRSLQEALDKAC